MRELGWRRYISKSDGECSLCALNNAVRDAMPQVDMIPKESLVGDHAANGEAQNAAWEEKLQQHVPSSVLTWLRCKLSGKTADQRRTGKRWLKLTLEL